MFAGMIDLDDLEPNHDALLATKVKPKDTILKFTNPFVVQNVNAKKPPVKPAPRLKVEFKKSSVLLADTSVERQGVLDLISPPRVWEKNGVTWMQQVSPQPTHRCQIQILREKVDALLDERGARDFGICPRRIEIYQQAFDEIIRQVTLSCAERGLLLLRVRDELKMTFTSYKLMFNDFLVYCEKQVIPMEESLVPLMEEKAALEEEIKKLKGEIDSANMLYEITQRRIAEKRHVENETHKDTLKANTKAKNQLKRIIAVLQKPTIDLSDDDGVPEPTKPKPRRIPIFEERTHKIALEEKKRKEKRVRRMKIKACKILRMKRINEKLRRHFERDMTSKSLKIHKETPKADEILDDGMI